MVNPSFFDLDFKMVHYLGNSTGRREASVEMLRFQDWNRDGGSFRTFMRIRVSGRTASLLAGKLFEHEPQEPQEPRAALLQH
jgi:hypothetical protein